MQKYLLAIIAGACLLGANLFLVTPKPVAVAQGQQSTVVFNADGPVQVPTGFRTFGHDPMQYEKTSAKRPVSECAGCHIANVAATDMTWIQFYPLLRDKPGY